MKNVFLVLFCLVAFSCEKEEEEEDEDCNCGLILSDRISDYSIVIRSSCSGNEERFTLNEGDWINAHPGDDYCITNSSGW